MSAGNLCEVKVSVGRRFAGVATDAELRVALEAQVTAGLERLCSELEVPVAAFDVVVHDDLDDTLPLPFRVTINGEYCRVPLQPAAHDELQQDDVARAAMLAIHANRELLLTDALAAELRLQSFALAPATAVIPPGTYRDLLRLLVRRGFATRHARNAMNGRPARPLDAETLYDVAVDWSDTRLGLRLPPEQRRNGSSAEDAGSLDELLRQMHEGLFYELGLVLPTITVTEQEGLASSEFEVVLNDVTLPAFTGLEPDEFLVGETLGGLSLLAVEGREAVNPATGRKAAIATDAAGARQRCIASGLTTWGPREYVVLHLTGVARKHAAMFITDEIVERHLDVLRLAVPDLVRLALERFGLHTVTRILRHLLAEDISIRDLPSILDALLSVNATTDADYAHNIVFAPDMLCVPAGAVAATVPDLTAEEYADAVRAAQRRYISHKYTTGRSAMTVYLLSRDIEARLAGTAQPLSEDELDRLRAAVADQLAQLPASEPIPALLTGPEVRRAARAALQREFPTLPILSYQELSPELNIQPVARIEV